MKKLKVKLKPLSEGMPPPRYETTGSSGMDLSSSVDTVIGPGEYQLIPTGFSMEIPRGYEAQVRPRSGLALRHGVGLLNSPGTIDSDYRGEVGVVLFNFGKEPFRVKRGDRIAQLVFTRAVEAEIELVAQLTSTKRGEGGFGHTGP